MDCQLSPLLTLLDDIPVSFATDVSALSNPLLPQHASLRSMSTCGMHAGLMPIEWVVPHLKQIPLQKVLFMGVSFLFQIACVLDGHCPSLTACLSLNIQVHLIFGPKPPNSVQGHLVK